MVRNLMPQIHEQILETVNAVPKESITERIVDIPVHLAEETVAQGDPTRQEQEITHGSPLPTERVFTEEATQNVEALEDLKDIHEQAENLDIIQKRLPVQDVEQIETPAPVAEEMHVQHQIR